MDTLGDRIRKFRTEKKLTQAKLGLEIGAKGTAVSNWELNLSHPEKKYIESMAKFFGIMPQELEYGNAPTIVNEPPEGYEIIPTKEYIEFLKYKAEKGEMAEKQLKEAKNIEVVIDKA